LNLPFTVEQFLEVFEKYNLAIWPMQIIAYLIGIAALFWGIKKSRYSDKIVSGILSFYWLWMGVVYHIIFFSSINKAGYIFGILFIIQGILFLIAVFKSSISFQFKADKFAVTGSLFILYAMLIYPIIGYLLGHGYPKSPVFGVAPCPATIFTFGILLWTDRKVPKYILVLPLLWSIIGFMAAISLGIREDIGLLVSGVIGSVIILLRDRKKPEDVITC
jgi:hypothetical protein